MVIDDDTLKQLLRINDALFQLCKFLNEKRDIETSSRLMPLVDQTNPHSDRSGQEQITMMQPYKGYFITGSALLVCCSIGVDDGAVEKTQALEEFVTESVVGSLQIAEMLGIEAP